MSGPRNPFELPELTPEDRKKALSDPGPSWREWWYGSALKLYVGLGLLILDSWVAGAWLEENDAYGAGVVAAGLIASLAAALYAEYVLYQYLWAVPKGDKSYSTRSEFRPTWREPFEYGRWTESGRRVRRGLPPVGSDEQRVGPDPSEFF